MVRHRGYLCTSLISTHTHTDTLNEKGRLYIYIYVLLYNTHTHTHIDERMKEKEEEFFLVCLLFCFVLTAGDGTPNDYYFLLLLFTRR
jgi:hypothetical protein